MAQYFEEDGSTVNTPEMVLRRAEYSLSDEQRALRETFAALLGRECPTERVRKAEPLGFDEALWRQLVAMRAVAMGVPAAGGGDGAGLVDLVLVAEQLGRALAPVPLVDAAASARLLARCGPGASLLLAGALDGRRLVALALHAGGEAQLVPSGAIADYVVGLVGDRLVAVACDERPAPVANHGDAPLAVWALGRPGAAQETLLEGPAAVLAYERARREWKLLMAAALVGIADRALELALDFARERVAFGVPIATFQGISHPLADCSIGIVGARRLVWKAAWFAEHEPDERTQLIPMAFLYASRVAVRSTTVGVHTQGGLGFTAESPMQLYFRRAKGWANVAGDPALERSLIADALYGPAA